MLRTLPPRRRISLPLFLLASIAASCGGGGGGGGSDAPAKPQNLVATPAGADIALTWDAVPGADNYRVYRSQTSTVMAKPSDLLGTTPNNSGLIIGLPAGFEFFFAVAAVRDGDASGLSDPASATVPPVPGVDPLLG